MSAQADTSSERTRRTTRASVECRPNSSTSGEHPTKTAGAIHQQTLSKFTDRAIRWPDSGPDPSCGHGGLSRHAGVRRRQHRSQRQSRRLLKAPLRCGRLHQRRHPGRSWLRGLWGCGRVLRGTPPRDVSSWWSYRDRAPNVRARWPVGAGGHVASTGWMGGSRRFVEGLVRCEWDGRGRRGDRLWIR